MFVFDHYPKCLGRFHYVGPPKFRSFRVRDRATSKIPRRDRLLAIAPPGDRFPLGSVVLTAPIATLGNRTGLFCLNPLSCLKTKGRGCMHAPPPARSPRRRPSPPPRSIKGDESATTNATRFPKKPATCRPFLRHARTKNMRGAQQPLLLQASPPMAVALWPLWLRPIRLSPPATPGLAAFVPRCDAMADRSCWGWWIFVREVGFQ